MNRNQQTHMGPSDACYYADHRGCPFPTMCECSCHKSLAGDSTPPATPVESPDEDWFQRQARLAARDVQLLPPWLRSHPPAVSGEGERLKRVIGDSLLALGAVRRRVVSVREENPASAKLASAQQKLEEVINVFEAVLRASTPTPGAPR